MWSESWRSTLVPSHSDAATVALEKLTAEFGSSAVPVVHSDGSFLVRWSNNSRVGSNFLTTDTVVSFPFESTAVVRTILTFITAAVFASECASKA